MAWAHLNANPRARRPERPAIFLVQFHDGRREVLNLPKELGQLGPSAVLKAALERQAVGQLPAGKIGRIARVR
jgi:hypothetical protein